VDRSRSRAFLFLGAGSFTSSEWRYLPAHETAGVWQMMMPREKDQRIRGGARRQSLLHPHQWRWACANFRLVAAPVDDPRPERFTELVPASRERDAGRRRGLRTATSSCTSARAACSACTSPSLDDGATHHIEFPEPTYEVSADANAEFVTRNVPLPLPVADHARLGL